MGAGAVVRPSARRRGRARGRGGGRRAAGFARVRRRPCRGCRWRRLWRRGAEFRGDVCGDRGADRRGRRRRCRLRTHDGNARRRHRLGRRTGRTLDWRHRLGPETQRNGRRHCTCCHGEPRPPATRVRRSGGAGIVDRNLGRRHVVVHHVVVYHVVVCRLVVNRLEKVTEPLRRVSYRHVPIVQVRIPRHGRVCSALDGHDQTVGVGHWGSLGVIRRN